MLCLCMIRVHISCLFYFVFFFFFKQKTAYEMRISDWSSDVCSSDLHGETVTRAPLAEAVPLPHSLTAPRFSWPATPGPATPVPEAAHVDHHAAQRPDLRHGDCRPGRRQAEGFGSRRHRSRGAQPADLQGLQRRCDARCHRRSEEHTSELQSLMRISYAV